MNILLYLSILLFSLAYGQEFPSKRGLAFIESKHESDTNLLLSRNSTISWYYTWSLWPSEAVGNAAEQKNGPVPFVPLVHGLEDASDPELASLLDGLPSSSTYLLSFNEPDEKTGNGGSAISPKDAAHSYMTYLAPLRRSNGSQHRDWSISHPAVSGSPRGLDWLRDFNETCFEIDDDGCPSDFVAVHWYGDSPGLVSWLSTLREFYERLDPGLQFWVTELALPKADEDETLAMMNETLLYLDDLDYIQAYAWFGAFRSHEANKWTGDAVSFLDRHGSVTELGSLYLDIDEGSKSNAGCRSPSLLFMLAVLAVAVGMLI